MKLTDIIQDLIIEAPIEAGMALALATVFLVLVGSMLMPLLAHSALQIVSLGLAMARRLVHWVVDKLIETVIVGLLTLLGWLWILDAIPGLVR